MWWIINIKYQGGRKSDGLGWINSHESPNTRLGKTFKKKIKAIASDCAVYTNNWFI